MTRFVVGFALGYLATLGLATLWLRSKGIRILAGLIAALLMTSSAYATDAKHYYDWLPYETFPTPTHDAEALRALQDAASVLASPSPNLDAVRADLHTAMAAELIGDRGQVMPVGMFAFPDVNQQVIGSIDLALKMVDVGDMPAASGFVQFAIIGGPYTEDIRHSRIPR